MKMHRVLVQVGSFRDRKNAEKCWQRLQQAGKLAWIETVEILPPTIRSNQSPARIVVDAGHGGKDPGAVGHTGIKEKDINLAIAHRLKGCLIDHGYRVVMTREGDSFKAPAARAAEAHRVGAQFFISIHANAHQNRQANGVETLYNPAQNTKTLAETLVRAVAEAVGIFNRGAKPREDLAVLRKAGVPALIVETAFISNPEEERLLVAAEEQEKIARAIARVVDDYCARL